MPHQAGVAAWLVYIYAGNRCHCSLGLFHSELNQFEPVYPRGVDGLRRHLAKLLALFFNTTDLDSPDQTTFLARVAAMPVSVRRLRSTPEMPEHADARIDSVEER
ncbi:hypothetical protein VCV18_008936 [Metarhizium anisopliae]